MNKYYLLDFFSSFHEALPYLRNAYDVRFGCMGGLHALPKTMYQQILYP